AAPVTLDQDPGARRPARPCRSLADANGDASSRARLLQIEERGTVLVDQLEHAAAAARDAGERVFGHHDGQARFFHQQLIYVPKEGTAAGQHDAALGDVRAELRWRLLERDFHRTDDAGKRLLQGFEDLVRVQRKTARHAFGQVATFDGNLVHLVTGVRCANLELDFLGRRFADADAVVAADGVDDRIVETIAADTDRCGVDDAVPRDHRALGCAAADVEHHGAARFVDRQPRTDGGSHRLFDEPDPARPGAFRRLLNRPAFDLSRSVRNADEHSRAWTHQPIAVYFLDEVLQHL